MRLGVWPWLVLAAVGCAGPPPDPPTAVIDASPNAVCVGDAYRTPITLSGARSAARLSLVPAPPGPDEPPLTYAGQLEGDHYAVLDGALDTDALTVAMAGERPLHVTLTVTTEDGGEAETLRSIGVIVAGAPSCDGGCESGTSCVQRNGREECLPDGECASDTDCDQCYACDPELARCVPSSEAP